MSRDMHIPADGQDWTKERIGALCTVESGASWSKDQESREGQANSIRIATINNVKSGRLNLDAVLYINGLTERTISRYRLRKGMLLMIGSSGSTSRVGQCAFVEDDLDMIYASFLYALKVDSDQILAPFLFYILNRSIYQERLTNLTVGSTTLRNLNKTGIESLQIPVPPLEEQRKIASVLYTADQLIEKTEVIINQVRQARLGLLNSLILGGSEAARDVSPVPIGPRTYEIPSSWNRIELGELAQRITKGSTPTTYGFEYKDEGIRFIKAESIDAEGDLITEKCGYIGKDADRKLTRSRLKDEDVLMSIAGALGKVIEVQSEHLPANINQALSLIRLRDGGTTPTYIRYFLEGTPIQKHIESISTTTAQSNLNLKQIAELPMFLPPDDEKDRIVGILRDIDEELRVEKETRNRLQALKKGLMQDLLSGRVRTNDKDIEIIDEITAYG